MSKEQYSIGEYKYKCIDCDFKVTLSDEVKNLCEKILVIINSDYLKDYQIVNLDGELVKINNETKKDEDYWIDVKLSKNKNKGKQLMVLVGTRKSDVKDKTQLFFDIENEKVSFDHNDTPPREIFLKVVGTFKNSETIFSDVNCKSEI